MIELADIVKEHPDAVFVRRTDAESFDDTERFAAAGYAMACDLLSATEDVENRTVVLKPNVVAGSHSWDKGNGEAEPGSNRGIVTDPDFVGGIVRRLQELGARKIIVAEGGGDTPMARVFDERGYARMTAECGVELLDLNKPPGQYAPEELNWTPVEGVVFREIPFVRPINDPDVLFINVPTMKTHNLGIISLCGKALQGTIAMGYRHFCSTISDALVRLDKACGDRPAEARQRDARSHYQPDVLERIQREYERHLSEGYPRWDQEGTRYEGYAQRACDSVAAHRGFLCIVEGVIGRDGTAFHSGKDILTNLAIGGVSPVSIDAVTAYLMGHDPRNIGFLKVAHERGLGEIDPERIPVFQLTDNGPEPCHHLEQLGRAELGVYFRGDNSRYVFF